MRKVILGIIVMLTFTGCPKKPCPEQERETIYVNTTCPTFDRKLDIYISDLNSTHGAISWEDVTKTENLLKAKKKFNADVKDLNSK